MLCQVVELPEQLQKRKMLGAALQSLSQYLFDEINKYKKSKVSKTPCRLEVVACKAPTWDVT